MISMGRLGRSLLATGLVLLWFSGVPDSPALARQNDSELFQSGRNCQDQILASVKKQKYRIYWERCIQPFEQLVAWYPDSPLADRSLFILGGLYRGLHGYSGSTLDRKKAISSYEALLSRYPDSPLSQKTRSRLEAIDPSPKVTVENIRHWAYPEYTRLVLDLNRSVRFKTVEKTDPSSVVVVLPNTRLAGAARSRFKELDSDLLKWVRLGSSSKTNIEVSVSLSGGIEHPKIVSLGNPDRLVIDLYRKPNSAAAQTDEPDSTGSKTAVSIPPRLMIQTIVIDPGHGGKDPGAIGRDGLAEKDVVLDIGRRVRKLIENDLGKRVIMTRNNDRFISLEDRTKLANTQKADLFVSIHANSHPKRSTRGIEIYLLGQSSDKHALSVAARENSMSLESMGDLDKTVQSILFDLGRDYKINQSLELADSAQRSFRSTFAGNYRYDLVDLRVKQAPFYVLLNSEMPGILAEVSYISNAVEEKLLRKDRYRQAIAETLFEAIRRYVASIESTS